VSLRRSLVCALLAGASLATSGRAQQTDVTRQVSDEFAYLKQIWPQVAEPRIVDSEAAEFREGQILLGRPALQRLADGGGDVVLQFILAHEAWHSVQAARHSQAELDGLRADRLLECEADFMAAAATADRLAKASVPAEQSQQSRGKLEDFIQRKAPSTNPANNYLSPESRAWTIALGWHAALKPELFSFVPDLSKHLDTAARQTCEMLANISDGSIGMVTASASQKLVWAEEAGIPHPITVILSNSSNKKIRVSYLLVEGWVHPNAPREIIKLIYDQKTIAPGSKNDYTYDVAFPEQRDDGGLIDLWLSGSDLLTTKYVEEIPRPADSCYGRLLSAADPASRPIFQSLATIALAAPDDFKAVRSQSFKDTAPGTRTYDFTAGLAHDDSDDIQISSESSFATLTLLKDESEDRLNQEYDRVKQLILSVCAATEQASRHGVTLTISEFAPGVDVSLDKAIWRIGHTGPRPPLPGGLVDFGIFKKDASK